MMRIERPYKDLRRRFVLFLLMSTFLLLANILRVSFKNGHEIHMKYTLHKTTATPSNLSNDVTGGKIVMKDAKSDDTQNLTCSIIAYLSIILVITTYLSLIWTRYLKDQPMNKQCLLNKICRDLIRMNTLYCWLWLVASVAFKMFQDPEQIHFHNELAKYFTLINEAIFFIMMMYFFLVGILRLYTQRFHVLDPLEEWFGGCEKMIMLCIRLLFLATSTFFVSMLYVNSVKPLLFYWITKRHMRWEDTPLGSRILYGIDIGVCIICGVLFTAAKIYQQSVDSKLQSCHYELGTQGKTNLIGDVNSGEKPKTNEETSRCEKESEGAIWWTGRISLTALLYIATALILKLIFLLNHIGVIDIDIWWGVTGMVGILGVVNPVVLFLWYRDLKIYCLRQVKSDIDNILGWINGFISTVKKFRPRIAPIQ